MYAYRAELIRVVDGDTLHLQVDLGFGVLVKAPVRLLGLNCAEMSSEVGRQAKVYVEAWFESDKRCLIETIKDKREKYGRYLARVVGYDGKCLNDNLLASGLAVEYMP